MTNSYYPKTGVNSGRIHEKRKKPKPKPDHLLSLANTFLKDFRAANPFENYGMSLLRPDMLNNLIQEMIDSEDIVAEFANVEIKGPAVQVLPLMIFV